MSKILTPGGGPEDESGDPPITDSSGDLEANQHRGAVNGDAYACIHPALGDDTAIQRTAMQHRGGLINYLEGSGELDIEALHRFMKDVGFEMDESPVSGISGPFSRALDGERGEGTKGFSPVTTDVSRYLKAKESLERSDENRPVIGLSVGGTNVKSGVAKISDGIVDITDMDIKNLKLLANTDGIIEGETEEDFWEALLPKTFLNWIRGSIAKGTTPHIALTLGYALSMIPGKADGKIMHLAGKAKFPALAPFDANEMLQKADVDYPTVAESFCRYLAGNGIQLDQNNIAVSPNDTVSAAFANGPTFINGTGTNACVITADGKVINTELGHFTGMDVSLLDTHVASPVDFEKLVSGKILGDIFKYTVSVLLGDDHALAQKFQRMSNEEACELLFSMYPAHAEGSSREITFLWNVALLFVERAANLIAKMSKAIEDATGQMSTYAIEGSVFTKNPAFVAMINEAFERFGGRQRLLESRKLPVNDETVNTFGDDLDGSFVGTFIYGACVE